MIAAAVGDQVDTVVMLIPVCPTSANFAAPTQADQPSDGMSTRSDVVPSPSGSMRYVPGSSGEKGPRFITSWGRGSGLRAGEGLAAAAI